MLKEPESTWYVLLFRMRFFYLVTTGWIFDISLLCESSINKSAPSSKTCAEGLDAFRFSRQGTQWAWIQLNFVTSGLGSNDGCQHYHVPVCIMNGHTLARVWINRVRLPILLVVSRRREMNIFLSAFAPENLVSRDGFGIRPVQRQPAHLHTQAESGSSVKDSSRVPRRHAFIYTVNHH